MDSIKNRLVVEANEHAYEKIVDLRIDNENDAKLETLMSYHAMLLLQENLIRTNNVLYSACLYDEQNRKKAIIKKSCDSLISLKVEDL